MLKNRTLLISTKIFLLILFSRYAVAQESNSNCYTEKFNSSESGFYSCEIGPTFIGSNNESFLSFLLLNTDYKLIEKSIPKTKKADRNFYTYVDTIVVSFVTHTQNENGSGTNFKMSNLKFHKFQNETIKEDLKKVIIKSSCNWRPGLMSGRMVKSLVNIEFIYNFRSNGSIPLVDESGEFDIKYRVFRKPLEK